MSGEHESRGEPARLQPGSEVADAMERVLAAEREARAAIEVQRAACAARVEAARLQARAILAHAEALARSIHARTERVAQARAAALGQQVAATPPDAADVEAALVRVAAWLTDDGDDES